MWIDPDKCNACGLCLKDCPLEVIAWHEEKARVGEGCVECRTCFRVCPKQAVVEIGEEIPGAIVCTACPVNCRISPERSGACRRFVNKDGELWRDRPLVLYEEVKPDLLPPPSPLIREPLITAIGAGTTYPDHIPAPYIVTEPREGTRCGHRGDGSPPVVLGDKNQSRHRRAHRGRGRRNPF